jgi:DNA-directed RNA polymerase, alpha subunit/40 kD subunit
MNKYLEGTTIEDILFKNKRMFHFQVMFTDEQMKQDIEVLDLKPRAYNCLRRYGFRTLENLVNGVYTKEDESSKKQLLRIRNLGRKTAEEILMKVFYYQFMVLPDDRKKSYMEKVVEANL